MSSDEHPHSAPGHVERFAEEVADPDEYNRTQRFKEIHQARQRVADFVANMETPSNRGEGGYYPSQATRLAHLVSLYILELEPLIEQSDIDDGELIPEDAGFDSLRDFAARMGVRDAGTDAGSPPTPQGVLQFYSAANRFYARVGMDLELEADKGDASFEYADILFEGPPGQNASPQVGEADD